MDLARDAQQRPRQQQGAKRKETSVHERIHESDYKQF
jgi:hypothetical protein